MAERKTRKVKDIITNALINRNGAPLPGLKQYNPLTIQGGRVLSDNIYKAMLVTEYSLQQASKGGSDVFDFATENSEYYTDMYKKYQNLKGRDVFIYKNEGVGLFDYGVSNYLDVQRRIDRNPSLYKEIYFDTETIGNIGKSNWQATEIALGAVDDAGKFQGKNFYLKAEGDALANIEDLLKRVTPIDSTGKHITDGLTTEQRRSLIQLADYGLDSRGALTVSKSGYKAETQITEELLTKIKAGFNVLQSKGLSGEDAAKEVEQYIIQTSGGKKVIMKGHNIENFDLKVLNKQLGKKVFGNYDYIDTMAEARYLNQNDLGIVGSSLDDLKTSLGIEINENTRHTAIGDIELNWKVSQQLQREKNKNILPKALQQYSIGSNTDARYSPVRNIYRNNINDMRYGLNPDGSVTPITLENGQPSNELWKHRLLDADSTYRINKPVYSKTHGWQVSLVDDVTGDVSIISRPTKKELVSTLDGIFGGMEAVEILDKKKLIEKEWNAMFNTTNGYYNMNSMLEMLSAVESKKGTNLAKTDGLKSIVDGLSGYTPKQKERFLMLYDKLIEQKDNLWNIKNTLDEAFPSKGVGGTLAGRNVNATKSAALAAVMSTQGKVVDTKGVKLSTGGYINGEDASTRVRDIQRYIGNKISHTGNPTNEDYRQAYLSLIDELGSSSVAITTTEEKELREMVYKHFSGSTGESGPRSRAVAQKFASVLNRGDVDVRGVPTSRFRPIEIGRTAYSQSADEMNSIMTNIYNELKNGTAINDIKAQHSTLLNGVYNLGETGGRNQLYRNMFQGTIDKLSGDKKRKALEALTGIELNRQMQIIMPGAYDVSIANLGDNDLMQRLAYMISGEIDKGAAPGTTANALDNILKKISGSNTVGATFGVSEQGDFFQLSLFRKQDANRIFQYVNGKETVNKNLMATLQIPIASDGIIRFANMEKINTVMGTGFKNGNLVLSNKQDEIWQYVARKMNDTLELVEQGDFVSAERKLKSGILKTVNSSSSASVYSQMVEDAISHGEAGSNDAQNYIRKFTADFGGALEDIIKGDNTTKKVSSFDIADASRYVTNIITGQEDPSKGFDGIKFKYSKSAVNKDNYKNFGILAKQLGLVNYSGIKAEALQAGKFSFADARDFMPMGALNSASKENTLSVLNYLVINENIVKEINEKQKNKKLENIFKHTLVTQTWLDVNKDRLAKGSASGIYVNIKSMTEEDFLGKWKDAAKKYGLEGSYIPGLHDDQAIMSVSYAQSLYGTTMKRYTLDENLATQYPDFIQKILTGEEGAGKITDEMLEDGSFVLGGVTDKNKKDIQKVLKLKTGDTVRNIAYNYETGEISVVVDELIRAEQNTKIISQNGMRSTILLMEDDLMKAIAGKDVGMIIEKSKLKTTNLAQQIGGRLDFVLNEAEKSAGGDTNKLAAIRGAISETFGKIGVTENETLADYIRFDDETGLWINSLDSKSFKRLTEGQRSDLIKNLYNVSDNITENLNDKFGIEINIEDMTRDEIRLTNIPEWHRSVGFGNKDYIDRNSPLRYGLKEISSLEVQLKDMEALGINASDYEKAIISRFNYEGKNKDANMIMQSLLYNTRAAQGEATKEGGNVLTVTAGGKGVDFTDGKSLALSDIYNDIGPMNKGYDPEGYASSTFGKLRKQARDMGTDYVKIDLSPYGLTTGQIGSNQKPISLDSIYLPLLDENYVNGKIIPGEIENAANNMFKTIDELTHVDPNDIDRIQELRTTLNAQARRLIATESDIMDKDSELYKSTMGFRLSNAGAHKAQGTNLAHYLDTDAIGAARLGTKDFDQIVALHPDTLREKLSIGFEKGSADYENALQNLRYQAKYLTEQDFSGKSEKEVIDAIIDYSNIDNVDNTFTNSKGQIRFLTGTANRPPSTSSNAVQHVGFVVSNSVGRYSNILGHGLAYQMNADFDGDTTYTWLTRLGGSYVSEEEFMKVAEQESEIWGIKQKVSQILGEAKAPKLPIPQEEKKEITRTIVDDLNKVSAARAHDLQQEYFASRARYGKTIGRMSNISSAIRGAAVDANLPLDSRITLESLMENLEQNIISSKKIEEMATKGDIDTDKIPDIMETFQKRMISAIEAGNINNGKDSVMGVLTDAGFAEYNKELGDYVLYDRHADIANAQKKAYGVGRVNQNENGFYLTGAEIQKSFDQVKEYIDANEATGGYNNYLNSYGVKFGKKSYDENEIDRAYDTVRAMDNGDGNIGDSRAARIMMQGTDSPLESTPRLSTSRTWTATADDIVDDFGDQISKNMSKTASRAADAGMDFLKNMGSKMAAPALAIGALWAGSAMIRPPRIDQTPAATEEQYADPDVASQLAMGAPVGAGPRAHLIPNNQVPYQINIRGNSLNNLTNAQISGIIESEMYNQAGLNVNLNISSKEDKNSYDRAWFDKKISAMF